MELNSLSIATREKLILAGLYLSKYDSVGLKRLGFDNFQEAFYVLGYAMGSKPASIKNYRDEFDPLFPNRRKGWHKRKTRNYRLKVFEEYEFRPRIIHRLGRILRRVQRKCLERASTQKATR